MFRRRELLRFVDDELNCPQMLDERRDVACVEIMELEIPRRVENVDVAHALAAITSSTVIEQPRASAPFARPFST